MRTLRSLVRSGLLWGLGTAGTLAAPAAPAAPAALAGPVPSEAAATQAPQPVGAAPSTALSAALATATVPTRAVSITAELEYCFAAPRADVRQPCFEQVAATISAGLMYQRCLWDLGITERGAQCPGIKPLPAITEESALQRRTLLAKAEALLVLLRDPQQQTTLSARGAAAELREQAARNIALERGQFTLISQGGVSLGSWQAGYTYLLSEVLKERRTRLALGGLVARNAPAAATLTGASAGAINALISGMEGCKPSPTNAKESLFFRVWVDTLGLSRSDGGGLFDAQGSGERLALFSKEPLETAVKLAKDYGERTSFLPGCSFNLGFVATHLVPAPTPVHIDATGKRVLVKAPRLTERFSFQVTLGDQRPPAIVSLPAPPAGPVRGVPDNVFYAHLGKSEAPSFDEVLSGVRASGAFPVAFPPVPLCYKVYDACSGQYQPGKVQPVFTSGEPSLPADKCSVEPVLAPQPTPRAGDAGPRCEQPRPGHWVTELFVDGGTLDNTPIRLAATINGWQDYPGPNPWFSDLVVDPNTYVFVNPGVLGWEPYTPSDEQLSASAPDSLLSTYMAFAGQLVSSGFDAQLLNTAEQLAFIRQETGEGGTPKMEVPRRNSPITGEQLAHFMAFFERDFRVYDFYVGVADGIAHVGERFASLAPFTASVRERFGGDWEFQCMQAYYAARSSLTARIAASGPTFTSQGALPACADSSGLDVDVAQARSNFRKLIAAQHNYRLWTVSEEHRPANALQQFLSELEAQAFTFRDTMPLGEGLDLSQSPRKFFRRLLQRSIDQLAEKHDFPQSLLFSDGGRLVVDALVRRDFPSWSWSVGFAANGPELGAQKLVISAGDWWALRADLRARNYRWGREPVTPDRKILTSAQEATLGLSNVIGLWAFSPGLVDLELNAAAGGYQVYSWSDSETVRTAPFFSLGLNLVVLQHLYLGLEHQRDLPFYNRVRAPYAGSLLDTLWDRNRWAGSVGWRWLH